MSDPFSIPRPRVFAVVPAAGFSRRMGVAKLLLPLGGRTVMARVLDALRRGGVDAIYVLARADDAALREELRGSDVCAVFSEEPTADMRASVELLLQRLARKQSPRPEDAWLLAPADHPVLDGTVVAALVAEWHARPEGIVVPVYKGRRGHPTLFGWDYAASAARLPPGQGLNRLLRDAPDQVRQVAVESPRILLDLDTPADYQRLKLTVDDD